VYSGDGNFKTSTSSGERFTVNKADATAATVVKNHAGATIDNGSNPASLGALAHDTATVSSANNSFTITGSVAYQLYSGASCASGHEIGAPDTQTMSSGSVPNSGETGALAAGDYSYQGVYSGDGNFKTSTGSCEPFTVNKADATAATVVKNHAGATIDNGSNPASLGALAHDTATVSSANNSFTITGSVAYQLYSGASCASGHEIGAPDTQTMSSGSV